MQPLRVALFVLLVLGLVGALVPGPVVSPSPPSVAGSGPGPGRGQTVVCLGDSLTAGYGLDPARAYPALAERILRGRGLQVRVVNAGVSGDTAAQGLARLTQVLDPAPDLVLVELGANDGLRHQSIDALRTTLRTVAERVVGSGARVALAGMRLPPIGDPFYARGFERAYEELAAELGVPLLPFLLEGVAGVPELNQRDHMHPNAEGQARVAATVADFLEPLLRAPGS